MTTEGRDCETPALGNSDYPSIKNWAISVVSHDPFNLSKI